MNDDCLLIEDVCLPTDSGDEELFPIDPSDLDVRTTAYFDEKSWTIVSERLKEHKLGDDIQGLAHDIVVSILNLLGIKE